MRYSIVIPAYNESDKITSTLTQVLTFMKSFTDSFEVIVVDDGSKDSTALIVFDYKKENKEVILVKNPHLGKGPAVSTGVAKAKGDLIYLADADLSTPISELKKFSIWATDHNYDIVIGSREGAGAVRLNEPFYRHFMGRVFNFFVQILLLPGVSDSQCGFKLFKREVAKKLFSNLQTSTNKQEIKNAYTGAWDVEILYIAKLLNYKIRVVSVTWSHVKTTKVSVIRDSYKMLKEILIIKIKSVLGKYKNI